MRNWAELLTRFIGRSPSPAAAGPVSEQAAGGLRLDAGLEFHVARPSPYPEGIVARIRSVVDRAHGVRAAYIAEVSCPDWDGPRLMVGVDGDGAREVAAACTVVLGPVLGPSEFVDFFELGPDGLSAMVRDLGPFFVRS